MAVHPSASEIATLFNEGDLSFVCNVGTLVEPVMSRDDYLNRLVDLPTDLFAHNEQVMSWQTSVADSLSNTGWGGRVADLLHAAQNGEALGQNRTPMKMAMLVAAATKILSIRTIDWDLD